MKNLTVALPGREYDILVAENILQQADICLKDLVSTVKTIAVISDTNVWGHYGESLLNALDSLKIKTVKLILKPGEGAKTLKSLEEVYKFFAEAELRRSDLIIALGGGVIGDLAGFAASTWMRGIAFVQVPSTLLAQVDSSVGGKTAINLPYGKNMVGSFYQPKRVLIDLACLKTLPLRELRCGLAEVIKYGAIASESLFEKFESLPSSEGALCSLNILDSQASGAGSEFIASSAQNLSALSDDCIDWGQIVLECCAIKAAIVARDELDLGERALLNFGHSFGHALENMYEYKVFNHGEGVALGMIIAASIGEEMGLSKTGSLGRIITALNKCGLETLLPCSPLNLLNHIKSDKKAEAKGLKMIFIKKIGQAFAEIISFEDLEKILLRIDGKCLIKKK